MTDEEVKAHNRKVWWYMRFFDATLWLFGLYIIYRAFALTQSLIAGSVIGGAIFIGLVIYTRAQIQAWRK